MRRGPAEQRAREDQRLVEGLSRQARALVDVGVDAPSPAAWHRLVQARGDDRSQPRRRRLLVAVVVGTGLAVALALVLGPRLLGHQRALTFEVGGGAIEQGGYVRATQRRAAQGTDAEPGRVRFSDGTQIDLGEDARLSVVAPGPRGARLRLDGGQARFRVAHRARAAWSVEAGPYVVAVTGTVFDVRWSSADELVRVDLHHGSVRVTGPGISDSVPLRAGQRLTAHPARGEVKIERVDDPAAAAAVPPVPQPGAAESAPGAAVEPARPAADEATGGTAAGKTRDQRSRSSARTRAMAWVDRPGAGTGAGVAADPPAAKATPATEPAPLLPRGPDPLDSGGISSKGTVERDRSRWAARHWATRVADGEAAAVLEEAHRFGLTETLAEADATSLGALGDAARYLRQPELAQQVLSQQRVRFPRTRLAAKAAFMLGRLADDRRDVSAALSWYGRYLDEAPRGTYADEALGRSMQAVDARQGAGDARALAERYLTQFPNGTYLLLARAIVKAASEERR